MMDVLDRLADASERDTGLKLTNVDVEDLLEIICELELQIEIGQALLRFVQHGETATVN